MGATTELDSQPLPVASSTTDPAPSSNLDLPIALWKGKRYCIYPLSSFAQYNALSPFFRAFFASLDSVAVPKTVAEACSHPGKKAVAEAYSHP